MTHSERRDKTEFRRFSVNLVEGENRLEAWAKTADGSWESEPAAIVLRYEKPLPKPELYLVAVGISAYAQDNYKLKFASQDAKDFAELFRRRHNALYANAHIVEILDDQATKSNIQKALSEVAEKAQPQDTVILFLAGHGTMLGQRYYFLPHDFRSEPGGNLEQDVSRQGLPADVLGDFLLKGAALRRLLILDTCASGGAVDLFQVASRNPFSFRREIERLSKDSGAFVVAASAATEEAKEPAALKHGVLSYVLLAGMRAAQGGPLEGKWLVPSRSELVVDAVEWFTYAEGHVPRLTKEYCGQEQNVEVGRKGRSFPVLPVTDP
ncbi:MAG: caspase family protein [Planctomycetia bacterium]|nr:caspase family protein [Planctomycetia bacterium]